MSAEIQRKCGYLKQYQLSKRVQFMQICSQLDTFYKILMFFVQTTAR